MTLPPSYKLIPWLTVTFSHAILFKFKSPKLSRAFKFYKVPDPTLTVVPFPKASIPSTRTAFLPYGHGSAF